MTPTPNPGVCPICGRPCAAGGKYAPWCSRGCQAMGKRRAPADPDVVARRMLYMEGSELKRLRTELDGLIAAQRARAAVDADRDLTLALLREEIEVLRWYGNKDCVSMADAELTRRRQEGRAADLVGAEAVITAERRRALAKLA